MSISSPRVSLVRLDGTSLFYNVCVLYYLDNTQSTEVGVHLNTDCCVSADLGSSAVKSSVLTTCGGVSPHQVSQRLPRFFNDIADAHIRPLLRISYLSSCMSGIVIKDLMSCQPILCHIPSVIAAYPYPRRVVRSLS